MRSVGGMTKEAWGPLFFYCMYAREKNNSEGIRRVSSGSLHGDVVSCQGDGSVKVWSKASITKCGLQLAGGFSAFFL